MADKAEIIDILTELAADATSVEELTILAELWRELGDDQADDQTVVDDEIPNLPSLVLIDGRFELRADVDRAIDEGQDMSGAYANGRRG